MADVDDLERAERDAAAEARATDPAPATATPAAPAAERDDDGASRLTSADYSTAFTPRNVAVGLAIVAGLVAFVASRRRRRGRDEDG
jgi:hypothetical protein